MAQRHFKGWCLAAALRPVTCDSRAPLREQAFLLLLCNLCLLWRQGATSRAGVLATSTCPGLDKLLHQSAGGRRGCSSQPPGEPGSDRSMLADRGLLSGVQVLVALQRLVNALGTDAPAAYPLLLPILQLCTDINQVTTWRHSKATVERELLFRPASRQPWGLKGPCFLMLLDAFPSLLIGLIGFGVPAQLAPCVLLLPSMWPSMQWLREATFVLYCLAPSPDGRCPTCSLQLEDVSPVCAAWCPPLLLLCVQPVEQPPAGGHPLRCLLP